MGERITTRVCDEASSHPDRGDGRRYRLRGPKPMMSRTRINGTVCRMMCMCVCVCVCVLMCVLRPICRGGGGRFRLESGGRRGRRQSAVLHLSRIVSRNDGPSMRRIRSGLLPIRVHRFWRRLDQLPVELAVAARRVLADATGRLEQAMLDEQWHEHVAYRRLTNLQRDLG